MNLHVKINSDKYTRSCSDKIYNFYIKNLENKVIEKKEFINLKLVSKLGYKVTYRSTRKQNESENRKVKHMIRKKKEKMKTRTKRWLGHLLLLTVSCKGHIVSSCRQEKHGLLHAYLVQSCHHARS